MILPNGFSWSHPRKPKSTPQQDTVKQDPQSRLALDQLGEQGEEMAERVHVDLRAFRRDAARSATNSAPSFERSKN